MSGFSIQFEKKTLFSLNRKLRHNPMKALQMKTFCICGLSVRLLAVKSLPNSLLNILAIKTNYHQIENFKRIEKKIEKNSINPIIGFDCNSRICNNL